MHIEVEHRTYMVHAESFRQQNARTESCWESSRSGQVSVSGLLGCTVPWQGGKGRKGAAGSELRLLSE